MTMRRFVSTFDPVIQNIKRPHVVSLWGNIGLYGTFDYVRNYSGIIIVITISPLQRDGIIEYLFIVFILSVNDYVLVADIRLELMIIGHEPIVMTNFTNLRYGRLV